MGLFFGGDGIFFSRRLDSALFAVVGISFLYHEKVPVPFCDDILEIFSLRPLTGSGLENKVLRYRPGSLIRSCARLGAFLGVCGVRFRQKVRKWVLDPGQAVRSFQRPAGIEQLVSVIFGLHLVRSSACSTLEPLVAGRAAGARGVRGGALR